MLTSHQQTFLSFSLVSPVTQFLRSSGCNVASEPDDGVKSTCGLIRDGDGLSTSYERFSGAGGERRGLGFSSCADVDELDWTRFWLLGVELMTDSCLSLNSEELQITSH